MSADALHRSHAAGAVRVKQRDGWRCRVCGSRKGVLAHHLLPRAQGGAHVLANGETLCRACHAWVHRRENQEGSILGVIMKALQEACVGQGLAAPAIQAVQNDYLVLLEAAGSPTPPSLQRMQRAWRRLVEAGVPLDSEVFQMVQRGWLDLAASRRAASPATPAHRRPS